MNESVLTPLALPPPPAHRTPPAASASIPQGPTGEQRQEIVDCVKEFIKQPTERLGADLLSGINSHRVFL